MELAEKGNNLNVDMTNEDATASKASESKHGQSLYSAMHDMDPRPVFLWGQAVGKNLCKLIFSHDMDPRHAFLWGQTTRPKMAFSFPSYWPGILGILG